MRRPDEQLVRGYQRRLGADDATAAPARPAQRRLKAMREARAAVSAALAGSTRRPTPRRPGP